MGVRGHARVIERYLGIDSLMRYGTLIELLDGGRARAPFEDLVAAP